MQKIFVLRLNSLLSSIDSPLRFDSDNEVVIPMPVIGQLQNYQGKPEKKKIASGILEYLESFDTKQLMGEGVKQKNGSTLYIANNYHDIEVKLNDISDIDKRVFQICLGIMREKPNQQVILVSKNPLIRLKARSIDIVAENFRDDLFPGPNDQYTGRIRAQALKKDIDDFYEKKYLAPEKVFEHEQFQWIPNMFVEIKGIDSPQALLGRYDGEKIVPFNFSQIQYPYGIVAKNVGQCMLMECLLTDWKTAPLVIVKGTAGTGKTYCSMAAALQGLETQQYERILVATPSETVGNERLGFLPGDIISKISPYLGGIRDNLSILLNSKENKRIRQKNERRENGEYYFESGLIQVQPIGFLRGRTIVDSIFIVDETQNIDPGDIKSIVTRAAEGSKFIFLGDPTQVDNPKLNEKYNGLVYLSEKMKGMSQCWQVSLDGEESVRSELSKIASKIL